MINYEDIALIKAFSKCLMEGIDPTTGVHFPEDTILNNIDIINYNMKVYNMAIRMANMNLMKNKGDFYLSESLMNQVMIVKSPIQINEFVNNINSCIPVIMKKTSANKIMKWLISNDFVSKIEYDNGYIYHAANQKGGWVTLKWTPFI